MALAPLAFVEMGHSQNGELVLCGEAGHAIQDSTDITTCVAV
jgi:hypothetical protein